MRKPRQGICSQWDEYFIVRETSSGYYYFYKLITNLDEAKKETERLCREERAKFYIVQIIAECEPKEIPIQWEWYKKGE